MLPYVEGKMSIALISSFEEEDAIVRMSFPANRLSTGSFNLAAASISTVYVYDIFISIYKGQKPKLASVRTKGCCFLLP